MDKKATLPEKGWDAEDVDGDVHGVRMIGTIESDLKNQLGLLSRIRRYPVSRTCFRTSNKEDMMEKKVG
jgi:hypothetical protein